MKFLHLSDLHLGRQLADVSLLPDQEAILDQIVSVAENEKADAVLISGDVYQRSSPQAEAMALFDAFVSRLAQDGRRVFVISGNHDSALRISYFSRLLRPSGVYVSEAFEGEMQKVTLKDEFGAVNVWMLPFLRPVQVKRKLPQARIAGFEDAVKAVLNAADVDMKQRNILMCHQFITGCETSDSEERALGGIDDVSASLFDGFDYVALGHIHKPQSIRVKTLRYAGSPLKYSFSEAGHKKSVTVVDMGPKGEVDLKEAPLYPIRDLRLLEGKLDELMQRDYTEDYVWITLKDELVPPDARVTLSVNYPNMLRFSVVNSRTKYDLDVQAAESVEHRSIPELFSDFYSLQNNGQAPGEAHMKLLDKVLREMEENHEAG
ncbi:MAG: exonuclease SbcCD subunit D [Clostridia bacterium]|nr:exonuclease SbcCD subunit D [Clostridia bacterium]